MAQPVSEVAPDVGPLVKRVHLMDPHPDQGLLMSLQRVQQAWRFTVGQRDNDVRPWRYEVQDVVWLTSDGQASNPNHGTTVYSMAGVDAAASIVDALYKHRFEEAGHLVTELAEFFKHHAQMEERGLFSQLAQAAEATEYLDRFVADHGWLLAGLTRPDIVE